MSSSLNAFFFTPSLGFATAQPSSFTNNILSPHCIFLTCGKMRQLTSALCPQVEPPPAEIGLSVGGFFLAHAPTNFPRGFLVFPSVTAGCSHLAMYASNCVVFTYTRKPNLNCPRRLRPIFAPHSVDRHAKRFRDLVELEQLKRGLHQS
jgi:hypothetical protein